MQCEQPCEFTGMSVTPVSITRHKLAEKWFLVLILGERNAPVCSVTVCLSMLLIKGAASQLNWSEPARSDPSQCITKYLPLHVRGRGFWLGR